MRLTRRFVPSQFRHAQPIRKGGAGSVHQRRAAVHQNKMACRNKRLRHNQKVAVSAAEPLNRPAPRTIAVADTGNLAAGGDPFAAKEALIDSLPRRRPGSSSLIFLALHSLRSDSGFRRNDDSGIFQRIPHRINSIRVYRRLCGGRCRGCQALPAGDVNAAADQRCDAGD